MRETDFKRLFVRSAKKYWPNALTQSLRDGAQAGALQGPRPCDVLLWHDGMVYAVELKLVKRWPVGHQSIALPADAFSIQQAASLDKIERTGNVGLGIVWFRNRAMGVDFAVVIKPSEMRRQWTRQEVLMRLRPFTRLRGMWPIPSMIAERIDGNR